MKVVVVDDYEGTAQIACTLLRVLGHEARGAATGRSRCIESISTPSRTSTTH